MTPISRKEAREQGLKHYFTGKPCKRGHVCQRVTKTKLCILCNREKVAEWKARNPNWFKEWRQKNLEHDRQKSREWQRQNRERTRILVAESSAARRARTPKWALKSEIRVFYEMAQRVSKCTGIKFSVDHIIPLRGASVSGLHVPWNLRVIPLATNISKGNRA